MRCICPATADALSLSSLNCCWQPPEVQTVVCSSLPWLECMLLCRVRRLHRAGIGPWERLQPGWCVLLAARVSAPPRRCACKPAKRQGGRTPA